MIATKLSKSFIQNIQPTEKQMNHQNFQSFEI